MKIYCTDYTDFNDPNQERHNTRPKYPGLLERIKEYDFQTNRYISQLEGNIAKLENQNDKLLDEALSNARANSESLLNNILSGAFDNITPTTTKEQLLERISKMINDFEKANPQETIHCLLKIVSESHSNQYNFTDKKFNKDF